MQSAISTSRRVAGGSRMGGLVVGGIITDSNFGNYRFLINNVLYIVFVDVVLCILFVVLKAMPGTDKNTSAFKSKVLFQLELKFLGKKNDNKLHDKIIRGNLVYTL